MIKKYPTASYSYPAVSAGYVGETHKDATLNSKFMGLFINLEQIPNERFQFPQRIPKVDFFKELYALEGRPYKKTQKRRLLYYKKQLKQYACDPGKAQQLINILNFLLRVGQTQIVAQFKIYKKFSHNEMIEMKYIKACALNELELAAGQQLSISPYLKIKSLINEQTDQRLKLLVLNRIIVQSYRHNSEKLTDEYLLTVVEESLSGIKQLKMPNFLNAILASVIYRGLAMVTPLQLAKQEEFLKLAGEFAQAIEPRNDFEALLSAENLYTYNQTMAKWYMHLKLPEKAKIYLQAMIALDRLDSTAYSEYGLFLIKNQQHEMAAVYFKNAFELGSPAVGMNGYFYGEMLESINHADAEKIYWLSVAKDPVAVSPLLALYEYYKKSGKNSESKKIVRKLLNKHNLRCQLEDNEILELKAFMKN